MSGSYNTVSVGVNGFGRFGLHLLRYWLLNNDQAKFSIDYINDSFFSVEQIADILENDTYIKLPHDITIESDCLVIESNNGNHRRITCTNNRPENIPWANKVDLFFECSGKQASKSLAKKFLGGKTKHVLISATAEDPDHVLIYGYNQNEHDASHEVISYGSCTINAYVPLAAEIHKLFGIENSDVHVIHNVPEYQLSAFDTLERRGCTLEIVAPKLLPFINSNNFTVTYTLVPYSGVSIIDYRFSLINKPLSSPVSKIRTLVQSGGLKGLYGLVATDKGPEVHKFSPYSAVIIESSIKLVGKNLYLQAYFDNENSVNRYFDTANHIAERINNSVSHQ